VLTLCCSALLKQLVVNSTQSPRPSIINCRVGGACCARGRVCSGVNTGICAPASDAALACFFLCTDYMNPEAFSENLVKCMQNDWQLGADSLLAFFPAAMKLAGEVSGVDMTLEFLKAELQKKPQSALRTITDAYLKLVNDAKKKRKVGDPWPVIIIDEANALTKWKDDDSLDSLLAFFVYLTKEAQLAHVILATSDTFLTQWLESGAPRLGVAVLSSFHCLSCGRRSYQRPVPRLACGGQPDAQGGAHVLLRLCPAQL